ncbi:MAG: AI-2E family transporter [Ruminococcaceae bacterium]|nr:AI-2E family transporter [Oscillospiraceae bacterium]
MVIKMARKTKKRLYNAIIIGFFVICAVFIFLLSFAYDSLKPIVYGCVIAYIFKPLCNRFNGIYFSLLRKKWEEEKSRRYAHVLSIVSTYVVWGIVLYVFVSIIVPQFVQSLLKIANDIPGIIDKLIAFVNTMLSENGMLSGYAEYILEELDKQWASISSSVINMLKNLAAGMITGIIGTVTFVFNFFVGIIVSVYLLSGRKKLGAQAKLLVRSVFDRSLSDQIIEEVVFADKMFSKYFAGSIIDSSIVGLVCYAGTLICGIPYGMLVAVIVGITNIIPFFGPYIGMIPSAVIIFTVSPVKALIFVVMMIVLQQIDGNILAPHIIGANTGLSSFWVLFAILLFGGLFGFVGMIIGVPVFACIYDILGKLMRFCLKKRGEDEAITNYEKEFLTEVETKELKDRKYIVHKVKKLFNREGQVISEEEVFYDPADTEAEAVTESAEETPPEPESKAVKEKKSKKQQA